MDDKELVTRTVAGDPVAERTFYDRHVERVYRLAYRMTGDEALAEDFTQETFIRAFDRLAAFEGRSALSSWLHSVAVTVILNGLRKMNRHRDREDVWDDPGSGTGIPRTGKCKFPRHPSFRERPPPRHGSACPEEVRTPGFTGRLPMHF